MGTASEIEQAQSNDDALSLLFKQGLQSGHIKVSHDPLRSRNVASMPRIPRDVAPPSEKLYHYQGRGDGLPACRLKFTVLACRLKFPLLIRAQRVVRNRDSGSRVQVRNHSHSLARCLRSWLGCIGLPPQGQFEALAELTASLGVILRM